MRPSEHALRAPGVLTIFSLIPTLTSNEYSEHTSGAHPPWVLEEMAKITIGSGFYRSWTPHTNPLYRLSVLTVLNLNKSASNHYFPEHSRPKSAFSRRAHHCAQTAWASEGRR